MLAGDVGMYLRAAMRDNGVDPGHGYYTSLVKAPKLKGAKQLSTDQINGCSQYLTREIDLLKPQVIVALGSNAMRYFAPHLKGNPNDLAGMSFYRRDLDATIVVGANPAALHFDPSKAEGLLKTFAEVADLITQPGG